MRRRIWFALTAMFAALAISAAGTRFAPRLFPPGELEALARLCTATGDFYVSQCGVVIEGDWDECGEFDSRGMAPASKSEHWGWIDRQGRYSIPCEWEAVTRFDGRDMAAVKRSGKWGWIDRQGRLALPLVWDDAIPFDAENMAAVRRGGRWGWIDRSGEPVIPFEWTESRPFDDAGRARVTSAGGEASLIDRKGNVAAPMPWDEILPADDAGMKAVLKGDRWGWVDRAGVVLIEPRYRFVGDFHDGLARVQDGDAWGYVDRCGRLVVQPDWEWAQDFDSAGLARVLRDGRWGWIDRSGELVIPCRWKTACDFDAAGMARVVEEGLHGWIDRHGVIAISCRWHDARDFDSGGMARVYRDGAWGWIDRAGRERIACNYLASGDFSAQGAASVRLDARTLAFLDRTGRIIRRFNSFLPGQPENPSPSGLCLMGARAAKDLPVMNALPDDWYLHRDSKHPLSDSVARFSPELGAPLRSAPPFDSLSLLVAPDGRVVWRSDFHYFRFLLLPSSAFFTFLAALCFWRFRVVRRRAATDSAPPIP